MAKIHPLPLESRSAHGGATHEAEVTYADLAGASGNTHTVALFNVVDKVGVEIVDAVLEEVFDASDATLISTSVTIGDGGLATRFLSATELNPSGTEVFLKGGTLANTSLPYVYTGDDTVDVFFTGTAAKELNTHTQGRLKVYVKITDARPTPLG